MFSAASAASSSLQALTISGASSQAAKAGPIEMQAKSATTALNIFMDSNALVSGQPKAGPPAPTC